MHPQFAEQLRRERIQFDDVMQTIVVPMWSFQTLALSCGIRSIDVLKIDCEGADCDILHGMLTYCVAWPEALPRVICFETNKLTRITGINKMISALHAKDYVVVYRGHDTILKRKMLEPVICLDFLCGLCKYEEAFCFFDHPTGHLSNAVRCCYGDECVRSHGGVIS